MDMFTLLVFLSSFTACLLVSVYIYFQHKFSYWKKKGVPCLKPRIIVGDTPDIMLFRKNFALVMADLYKKFEGHQFGGFYQSVIPTLLIRDPDLIKDVLVKNFDHFHDHGIAYDEKIDPISGNLFFLKGARWKEIREKLSPTFTSGKLKMMFQTLADCGEEFKEYLKEPASKGEILEVKEVLAKFTTDIIASAAFGIQCNCLKNPDAEFRKMGRQLFEPRFEQVFSGVMYLLAPSIAVALKLTQNPKKLTDFFYKVVKETVEYREKNNVQRKDFMQLLIQLKNKGTVEDENSTSKHTTLNMDEVTANAFVFFGAGFETSSTAMTFALYELALNLEIQDRLRNEIDQVLEKHGGKISYDAIQEMTYLEKVVSETLRKYPPAPNILRECTKDYTIPDTDIVIEKGTKIFVPAFALHYDPLYYPNPRKFNPENFSEAAKSKRHHYTYLPFGEGPRICIGMRFALMQTKVGLVSILSNYEINICEKTSIPVMIEAKSFILLPRGGMWLRIKNRKEKRK